MPRRERLFAIREADIQQLLFADNSDDDEDDLLLDEEDQNFLFEDIDNVSQEVIIEHPDSCSTAESDTGTAVVCAPVKPQSFYSKPKRTCNTGTPAVVPGEQEQSMEVQPTTSSSKSTTRTGRRRKSDARNPDDPDYQATPPTGSRNCSFQQFKIFAPMPVLIKAAQHQLYSLVII